MNRYLLLILTLMIPSAAVASGVKEDAIRINISASEDLNMFDNLPHSTVVALYQFESPETIRRMMKEKNGMSVLLKAKSFSKEVKAVRKEIVHPGSKVSIYWDKQPEAKYLAVVGGFFIADAIQMVKVYPVIERIKSPFFWMPRDMEKADSVINILLSRRSMQ
ncbi:MAG: type VI secretion lipoprotein TssJ [Gammaproteobacteria bacterium]|nr:type VI secretion lipoprotein TssJ [Gammaproteobacteria bacterium]